MYGSDSSVTLHRDENIAPGIVTPFDDGTNNFLFLVQQKKGF
jgi:hypothetical protein